MDGEDNTSSLRVASFSCYLNNAEENIVLKLGLGGAIHEDPAPQDTPPRPISFGRIKNTDGEISIFGANKYFNMPMDLYESGTSYGRPDLHRLKPIFRQGIPSVSSDEASSLNSQIALLQNLQRNPSRIRQKRVVRKRFFARFGCHGSCSDKEGVQVNEDVEPRVLHGTKQSQPGIKRGEQFAFPILNSVNKQFKDKKGEEEIEEVEDDPRKSLDVFGSDTMKKRDIATNLERKLSILTWDAIPKSPNIPTTSFGSATMCDDMASDASSDLFEIDNISGTGCSILTRQASDNATQYAPSEGSIEWSVVTASAADFSSVVCEYDEKKITVARSTDKTAKTEKILGKEAQKSYLIHSRLLGCKSHKSVRVAESAYRTSEKLKRQGSDSSITFGNLQIEKKEKERY